MDKKPKVLKQQSKSTLELPHSIEHAEDGALKCIFDANEPISVGDEFYLTAQSSEPCVVSEVKNIRTAKGEWGQITAMYCEVFFNNKN